jgi:hypothetical protein
MLKNAKIRSLTRNVRNYIYIRQQAVSHSTISGLSEKKRYNGLFEFDSHNIYNKRSE